MSGATTSSTSSAQPTWPRPPSEHPPASGRAVLAEGRRARMTQPPPALLARRSPFRLGGTPTHDQTGVDLAPPHTLRVAQGRQRFSRGASLEHGTSSSWPTFPTVPRAWNRQPPSAEGGADRRTILDSGQGCRGHLAPLEAPPMEARRRPSSRRVGRPTAVSGAVRVSLSIERPGPAGLPPRPQRRRDDPVAPGSWSVPSRSEPKGFGIVAGADLKRRPRPSSHARAGWLMRRGPCRSFRLAQRV